VRDAKKKKGDRAKKNVSTDRGFREKHGAGERRRMSKNLKKRRGEGKKKGLFEEKRYFGQKKKGQHSTSEEHNSLDTAKRKGSEITQKTEEAGKGG